MPTFHEVKRGADVQGRPGLRPCTLDGFRAHSLTASGWGGHISPPDPSLQVVTGSHPSGTEVRNRRSYQTNGRLPPLARAERITIPPSRPHCPSAANQEAQLGPRQVAHQAHEPPSPGATKDKTGKWVKTAFFNVILTKNEMRAPTLEVSRTGVGRILRLATDASSTAK